MKNKLLVSLILSGLASMSWAGKPTAPIANIALVNVNGVTNQCLGVNGVLENGSPVKLMSCDGHQQLNQRADGRIEYLYSDSNKNPLCLDVDTKVSNNLQLYACNTSTSVNQFWVWKSGSSLSLKSKNLCVVPGNGQLEVGQCDNAADQVFYSVGIPSAPVVAKAIPDFLNATVQVNLNPIDLANPAMVNSIEEYIVNSTFNGGGNKTSSSKNILYPQGLPTSLGIRVPVNVSFTSQVSNFMGTSVKSVAKTVNMVDGCANSGSTPGCGPTTPPHINKVEVTDTTISIYFDLIEPINTGGLPVSNYQISEDGSYGPYGPQIILGQGLTSPVVANGLTQNTKYNIYFSVDAGASGRTTSAFPVTTKSSK